MNDARLEHRTGGRGSRSRIAATVLVLLAALMATVVAPAAAAPPGPTLSLEQLQVRLDAGPVTGYFLTVDKGSHIATVPMTVLSIAGGAGPDGALIMFSADMSDPLMQRIGTIAAGMSGSPLYIPDPGGDLLIGALSYGDIFTLDGLALATPVEYMSAVEGRLAPASASPPRTLSLSEPVRVPGDGVIGKVRIVADARTALPAGPGVATFAPLAPVELGGLPAQSRAYAALSAALERRGHTVVRGLGSGSGGWDAGFTTPLVGGASLAVMYTRGDLWAGALGTVTYVNGDHVVAFGHPLDWVGPTSLYLCNAQIDGIWADSLSAYKIGTPGAVRGIISQDRGSALAGAIGAGPAETPVTSRATTALETTTSAAATTWIASKWADDPFGADLAAAAASVPVYKAADRAFMPGSATTDTTVVVSDGTSRYTVHRANIWDDPWDVLYATAGDVYDIVYTLTEDPSGTAHAAILSVDSKATVSQGRRAASVADVSVAGGLHAGANKVLVTLDVYGRTQPLVVPVTLSLPPGTPTEGMLTVEPAAGSQDDGEEPVDVAPAATAKTLAEVVAGLNAAPTNDQLEVTFAPMPFAGPESAVPSASWTPVSAAASTGFVVSGRIAKQTAGLTVRARPARVYRDRRTTLTGSFSAAGDVATVRIYRRYRGERAFAKLATVRAPVMDGQAVFAWRTPRVRKIAAFKVMWDGDQSSLGATALVRVTLRR